MPLGTLIRRLLLHRLMRYRVAWFAFSLLAFYLTGVLVLVIGAQSQQTASGSVAGCHTVNGATEGTEVMALTLRDQPSLPLQISSRDFDSGIVAELCHPGQYIRVRYETNVVHEPFPVDTVTVESPGGALHTTESATGRSFATRRVVELAVVGGGMTLISLVMLTVAIFWARLGPIARSTQRERRREETRPLPPEFLAQSAADIRWLDALPWAVDPEPNAVAAYVQFQRGLALVRGWCGDEEQLLAGVRLLVACPPALAYTGAAEVALQLGAYDLTRHAPPALDAAERYSRLALAAAPGSLDARFVWIETLAARAATGNAAALSEAQTALASMRTVAAGHPLLPYVTAAVYLARRQYTPAIASLRTALALAPTQEEARGILDLLAQVLLRAGDLRQALQLFVKLNLQPPDTAALSVPVGQRRLNSMRAQGQ